MSKSVESYLQFNLEIDINTGMPKKYKDLSAFEQHRAKDELLEVFRKPGFKEAAISWDQRMIQVDDNYHEVVEPPGSSKAWVTARFAFFRQDFQQDSGVLLDVGDPCPMQLCAKNATCGHDCMHCFEMIRADNGEPWKLTSATDKVQANVMIVLKWTTPAAMAAMGGM